MIYKNNIGFTIVELMIVIAIIGILSAIAIAQYQNYMVKVQAGRIIGEIGELRLSVEDCLNNGVINIGLGANECDPRASPSNIIQGNSQVGIVLPDNTGVAQITNPLTQQSTITATISNQTSPVIHCKKIFWERNSNGRWYCKSNIEQKYLGSNCNFDNTIN
jgi:type IV pilus assembly protein PilA